MPPPPAVLFEAVSKRFHEHAAVLDLSFSIPRGSIYGFLGPNGSGKTTTLRMMTHILLPDSGKIEILGETGTRAANDRVGYLPEERGLYKKMTVRRQLAYYAALKSVSPSDAENRIQNWLKKLGLSSWSEHRVEALSKGMMQKIQFIATVIAEPELVILDEPFSGLDPLNAISLKDAVRELRTAGATVILSTHDMEAASELCDSVLMLYKGGKVLDGPIAAVKEDGHSLHDTFLSLAQRHEPA